ncbi:2-dehydropantoate 2-reductase [Fusarium sp. NRRL 25303]|nr:2-dehydropantoate 2-reductase [Fusarium sp. NRRL 25303]
MGSHAFSLGLVTVIEAAEAARQFILSTCPNHIDATDSFEADEWTKAIFNAAVNTSTALLNLDTHQVMDCKEGRTWLAHITEETTHVALAAGVNLPHEMTRRVMQQLKQMPSFTPSMLQDRRNCKALEIEPILGRIMMIAEDLGVGVPWLTRMHTLLEQLKCVSVSRISL